jgi:hypothetical protein
MSTDNKAVMQHIFAELARGNLKPFAEAHGGGVLLDYRRHIHLGPYMERKTGRPK